MVFKTMSYKLSQLTLILLFVFSLGSKLFAADDISVYEKIIQSVREGKIPLVPVQLASTNEIIENNLKVSVVNKDKLKDLFKEIRNKKYYLQYNSYVGGCESRALKIAQMLDRRSITSIKVFLRRARYYHGVHWPFHVATVIFMVEENEIQPFVIDPTINENEAINIESWYNTVGVQYDEKGFFTNRFVYLPEDINSAEEIHDYRSLDNLAADGQLLLLKGLPANGKLFDIIPL